MKIKHPPDYVHKTRRKGEETRYPKHRSQCAERVDQNILSGTPNGPDRESRIPQNKPQQPKAVPQLSAIWTCKLHLPS